MYLKQPTRARLLVVAIAAAVLGACGNSTDEAANVDCDTYRIPSKDWKDNGGQARSDEERHIRRMAADAIVDCDLLIGRTTEEVRQTLGGPNYRDPQGWTYVVGRERGPVVVDDELLQISFANGRVSDVSHSEG